MCDNGMACLVDGDAVQILLASLGDDMVDRCVEVLVAERRVAMACLSAGVADDGCYLRAGHSQQAVGDRRKIEALRTCAQLDLADTFDPRAVGVLKRRMPIKTPGANNCRVHVLWKICCAQNDDTSSVIELCEVFEQGVDDACDIAGVPVGDGSFGKTIQFIDEEHEGCANDCFFHTLGKCPEKISLMARFLTDAVAGGDERDTGGASERLGKKCSRNLIK